MPARILKQVNSKYRVEFDDGKFDKWCIYLTRHNHPRYAPFDVEYFTILQQLGDRHGRKKIYDDFVKIYTATTKQVDESTLQLIVKLASTYAEDSAEIEIWFTILYAGMLAEENKDKAVLGKRIKRLGMHQLLMDGMEPLEAANFSKEKKYPELNPLMKSKGF
jgi:hypothetical protein